VIHRIGRLVDHDRQFDVLGGAAGAILALLSVQDAALVDDALTVAVRSGDHLIAHARTQGRGVGWTLPEEEVPLSGFAHGAAGIALALFKLWSATGAGRFRATAEEALTYERSLFSAEASNWLDLRSPLAQRRGCAVSWCHGAPGIGLARLELLGLVDDAVMSTEIDAAVQATLEQPPARSHALCHGTLGNLELLLQAATHLKDARLWERLHDR
jgi:lantibiotic modifying enzyme